MTTGQRIRKAMENAGISTQQELADRINRLQRVNRESGVKQQTIGKLLNDKLISGHSTYFSWIALACDVRLEWLLKGEEPMTHTQDQNEHQMLDYFRQLPLPAQREMLEMLEFKLTKLGNTDWPANPAGAKLMKLKR